MKRREREQGFVYSRERERSKGRSQERTSRHPCGARVKGSGIDSVR